MKTSCVFAVALVLALGGATSAAGAQSAPPSASAFGDDWIGYVVPPYPSGWSELSGSCIGSGADPCQHSITVIADAQSGMRMILGMEAARHFGQSPLWRIVAALEPDSLFDRSLDVVHGTCQEGDAADGTIVAVVRHENREWLPAREAWRFDVANGRLVPLRAAGVRCVNEGFGE